MGKKKKQHEEENLERWLLTYADLITLLLAFFIVMYSMSKVDAKKFGAMAQALNSVLRGGSSVFKGEAVIKPNDDTGAGPLKVGDLKMIETKIKQIAEEQNISAEISSKIDERGLVVHILETAFFDLGKADLKSNAKRILDLFAKEFIHIPNHIRIEGHTDITPIHTERFPSNWELSTARATEVVRYLVEKREFPPTRISALGYGEYRPLVANDTEKHKAQNRRVDVVVLALKDSKFEPKDEIKEKIGTISKNLSQIK
jgi:chemotaxis protein MotB